jgi:hypothetical protein
LVIIIVGDRMDTCFKAKQSVDIWVPTAAVPIQRYLQQSARLVEALASSGGAASGLVEALGGEYFRLKIKPLKFLSLTLQPIVDLQVWLAANDVLQVRSVGCEILGLEQFDNPQFTLQLAGQLQPVTVRQALKLQGGVDLRVDVAMPMPIALTPKPILEATGNAIMLGVLTTMKQRLMKNLVADYQDWVKSEQRSLSGVI